jgi:hypothetical protein
MKLKWFDLQLFGGEGAGASGTSSGGEGTSTGDNGAVAAEQRLVELGVPQDRAKKRASRVASLMPTAEVKREPDVDSAPTEEENAPAVTRLSWDDIKKDPEYKKAFDSEVQGIIKARLKSEKPASEALNAMTPAIELMARKYGLDAKNMDYKALADAINNDDAYYEEKAMEMGTSVETAKRVDQMEREDARRKEIEARTLEQNKLRNHFIKLEGEAEQLKQIFPNFDLRTELQNPVFARMTSPDSPLSLEDAYYAVHRKEIQLASMQIASQKTKEQISSAIQSGQRRPDELGSSSQAPSASTFDYSKASKAQRDAIKAQIRAAKARGETLYPNQIKW